MSKWKIFMMCLMVLALLAMPLLACGGDGGAEYDLIISVDPASSGTTNPSAGTLNYDEDDEVTIEATAASGYEFDHWSGDVADPDSASTTVTMDADKTVTANFTEIGTTTYDLTYTAGPNGTLTGDTSQTVNSGEDGTAVEAVAATGYHFINWSDGSTDNPRTDTSVMADIDVTANFAIDSLTYDLTYTAGPNGTLTGDTAQTVNSGEDGTAVEAVAATGYHFVNWSDGSTDNPRTDTSMMADIDVTANFAETPVYYDLTMTAVTGNGSTNPAEGTHTYAEDEVVNITATPDSGWQFDSWTGDVADTGSASTTVTMDENQTVTANFTEITGITHELTMTAVTGNGSTSPAEGTHTYAEDEVVNITATPDSGWQFDSWTGDVADTGSASTTVTMDENQTVTANFTEIVGITYELTMAVTGNGSTNPAEGTHTYAEDEVVNITATPDSGWQFDSWTGDVADTGSASTTVTMDENQTVTANFTEIVGTTYDLTMAVSGSGSIDPAVGGHTYNDGDVVSISATPAAGWEFDSWTGDVAASGSASTTVTMDADKTVTAVFNLIPSVWGYEATYVDDNLLLPPTSGPGFSTNTQVTNWIITNNDVVALSLTYPTGTTWAGDCYEYEYDFGPDTVVLFKGPTMATLDAQTNYYDVATGRKMLETGGISLYGILAIAADQSFEWIDADTYIKSTVMVPTASVPIDEVHDMVTIAGTETVVTAAGTYECIVVEDWLMEKETAEDTHVFAPVTPALTMREWWDTGGSGLIKWENHGYTGDFTSILESIA